jgi:hypothetical protein
MYQDFFIRINGEKPQYTIEVYGPRETSVEPVKVDIEKLQNLLTSFPGLAGLTDAAAYQTGQNLYRAIFQPPIQEILTRSEQILSDEDAKLRIKLAVRPPELSVLPWELLYRSFDNRFITLLPRYSVVRFIDSNLPIAPLAQTERLQLLYVSAQPANMRQLDIETSQRAVIENIKQYCDVDIIEQATPEDLRKALRKNYHILHFDGHAYFDTEQQMGYVCLCDSVRGTIKLSSEDLAVYLNDAEIRLVVLNACNTGTGSMITALAGVAHQIMRTSSIPAVVAMQQNITDRLAIAFNTGFYSTLAKNTPVDDAVLEGRKVIQDEQRKDATYLKSKSFAWAIPVLFMRSRDGLIFQSLDERLLDMQAEIAQVIQHTESTLLRNLALGINALLSSLKVKERSDQFISGLATQNWGEPEIIFGRQEDTRAILEKIMSHRLVLVSSESDSDVSEVLRAGIVARLIANGEIALHLLVNGTNPGTMIRQVFVSREDTRNTVGAEKPLAEFLSLVSALLPGRAIYIVLENFERFFKLEDAEKRSRFLSELQACLEQSSLPVHWVLVVNQKDFSPQNHTELETYVGAYKAEIPFMRLDCQQAKQLIQGLAWKNDLKLDDKWVENFLKVSANDDSYSPEKIRAEIGNILEDEKGKDFPEEETISESLDNLAEISDSFTENKTLEKEFGVPVHQTKINRSAKNKWIVIIAGLMVWGLLLIIALVLAPTFGDELPLGFLIISSSFLTIIGLVNLVILSIQNKYLVRLMCWVGLHAKKWIYDDQNLCSGTWSCQRCGYIKKETRHVLGKKLPDKDNSCRQTQLCSRCGHKKIVGGEKHELNWKYFQEGSCEGTMVCTRCGYEVAKETCHEKWSEPDYKSKDSCMKYKICLRCGESQTAGENHVWGAENDGWYYIQDRNCSVEKVCLRCQRAKKSSIRHQWGPFKPEAKDSCRYISYCERKCGAWMYDSTPHHNWGKLKYTSIPNVDCKMARTCIICGFQTEPEEKHVPAGWEQNSNTGNWEKTCKNCGRIVETSYTKPYD